MDETQKTIPAKEICSIRIAFPVDTDEQAIEYKRKIGEVIANIPQARIEFNLMSVPYGVDLRPANR